MVKAASNSGFDAPAKLASGHELWFEPRHARI